VCVVVDVVEVAGGGVAPGGAAGVDVAGEQVAALAAVEGAAGGVHRGQGAGGGVGEEPAQPDARRPRLAAIGARLGSCVGGVAQAGEQVADPA
jgi:hypothetical protein